MMKLLRKPSLTGVCGPSNVDYVKRIGADRVIDYKTTNWEQGQDGRESYDVILDTGGTHIAFAKARQRLSKTGFYIDTFPDGARFLNKLTTSHFPSQHCLPFMLKTDAPDGRRQGARQSGSECGACVIQAS